MVEEDPREHRSRPGWRAVCLPRFVLIISLGLNSVFLASCDVTSALPKNGFLTNAVMGWNEDDSPNSTNIATASVIAHTDKGCRDVAETRMSDATLNQFAQLSDADLRHIYDWTYSDCVKWRGK